MQVEKKDLEKSQIELNIELSYEEFKPFVNKGAVKVSRDVKIEGFRPGKVPYEILKQKIGEMTILEEAGRLAVNDTLGQAIKDHVEGQPVGSPRVDITKLAPNNPFAYKAVLALIPELTLGVYKGLKIKQKPVKTEDKEAEKMMQDLLEMRAKEVVVDRAIEAGDKVLIDLQMFLDNVPLEGGQSQNTAVIVGKDYIVPGFDKKLIGAKKQDTREFTLPYPQDFHMKNIAGKLVEFKVTVKDVFQRELSELNETFARGFGAKSIEELKQNINKSIQDKKDQAEGQRAEREMLERIAAKTKFGDIPEMLVESETHNMLHELEDTIKSQGGKFEDYLSSLKKTRDQLTLDLLPEAVKRVKITLLIREIAHKEKIKVTAEEVDKQLQDMKRVYKDNKDMMAQLGNLEYKTYLTNAMASQKVVEKLKEWNVID